MYVLFIPSFPNNRFHLGNIRNNTLSKQKRERKKEEEQEAEVQSLRYKQLRILYRLTFFAKIFVTLFLFLYFIRRRKGCFDPFGYFFVNFCFLTFSFLFVSFVKQQSLTLRDSQIWQRLELFFLFWVLQQFAKKHVAVRATTQVRLFVFHVTVVFGWSFALILSIFLRKSESAFACAYQERRRNVFYSEHSFPYNKKKNKHRIVLFYASVSPLIRKNKLREKT